MALLAYTVDELDALENQILSLPANAMLQANVEVDVAGEWPFAGAIIDRTANPILASYVGGSGGDGTGPTVTTPPQYIRGRVVDIEGVGAPRVVIAVDRATGQRMAITTSDPGGYFTLRPRTLDPCILVAVPLDGEQLNAVVLDNISPVPD